MFALTKREVLPSIFDLAGDPYRRLWDLHNQVLQG
jgi:hypothetical protein